LVRRQTPCFVLLAFLLLASWFLTARGAQGPRGAAKQNGESDVHLPQPCFPPKKNVTYLVYLIFYLIFNFYLIFFITFSGVS
jgi:hypothetical protein